MDTEPGLQERLKYAPKRQVMMVPAGLIDRKAHRFLTIERVDPSPGRAYFILFVNGQRVIDKIDAEELYARIGAMLGEETNCQRCDGEGIEPRFEPCGRGICCMNEGHAGECRQ